jgi:hypothetical protein
LQIPGALLEAIEPSTSALFVLAEWERRCRRNELRPMHTHLLTAVRSVLSSAKQPDTHVAEGISLYAQRRGGTSALPQWRVENDAGLVGELDLPVVVKDLSGDVPRLCQLIVATALLSNLGDLLPAPTDAPTDVEECPSFPQRMAVGSGPIQPRKFPPLVRRKR